MTKVTLLCILGFLCSAVQASGQSLYQGPDTGSVPSGVIVSTTSFLPEALNGYPGPLFHAPRNEMEIEDLPAPPNMIRPTAPEGSNYRIDPSVRQSVLNAPPLQLQSFQGIPDQGIFIPPDPYLAAGPDEAIAVVNSRFRIIDKLGNTLKTIDAQAWFTSAYPSNGAFDPKVIYDHFAGRWVMVWLQQDDATRTSHYLISVSDGSSALGTWYNWALPGDVSGSTVDSTWADYEGVGFDQNAIYITSNQWTFGTNGTFKYMRLRIIPKAQLYGHAAGPVQWTDFWDLRDPGSLGTSTFGARPTRIYGTPADYFVMGTSRFNPSSYFVLYRVSNPLSSPTITGVTLPATAWSSPPNANQLGGSTILIEGGGGRLLNEPVYRDSSIWAVHCIASGTGNAYSSVRYVRVNTVTNTVTEDAALGANGFWSFYAAVGVDQNDNVAITYSRSGTTEYAGAFMTWRLNSDPASSLRPSVTIQPGKANYVKDFTSGRNRWGDYNGVWLDPVDQNNFWMFTEYAESPSSTWGTWFYNTRLIPLPGKRINVSVKSANFGRIVVGNTSDTLTVTLTNYGATPLNISGVTHTQSSFVVENLPGFPQSVSSLDSIAFQVFFRPAAPGVVNDSLVITSDDSINSTVSVPLTAKGLLITAAQGGILYAGSSPPASSLYTVDYRTGTATTVGTFDVPLIQTLTVRPSTHELYGSASTTTLTTVYRLSAGYGSALQISTFPVGSITGMAFNDGDTLYAISSTGSLYIVNLSANSDTLVGKALGISPTAICFKPHTDQLWCSVKLFHSGPDRIFTININTGAATVVGPTGLGVATTSLGFGADGKLYGMVGLTTSSLILIDTATGAATTIGSMGVGGLTSLAMRPDTVVTGVSSEPPPVVPRAYALEQNYPNPFNPSTQIHYSLPQQSSVRLSVYDVVGQEIRRLVDGVQSAGFREVVWDGTNAAGMPVASGIYFYRIEASAVDGNSAGQPDGHFTLVRKMLLLR